jgi:hypothetical protein
LLQTLEQRVVLHHVISQLTRSRLNGGGNDIADGAIGKSHDKFLSMNQN